MEVKFMSGDKEYVGRLLSTVEAQAHGLESECNCGEERCVGGFIYRCGTYEGGECRWYSTAAVCQE